MEVAMTFASVLAPVVLALVQVVKTSFPLPKNIVPLLGLILGIIVGYLAYPFTDLEVSVRIWSGAIAGLTSVGLFETFNIRNGTTTEKTVATIIKSEPIIYTEVTPSNSDTVQILKDFKDLISKAPPAGPMI